MQVDATERAAAGYGVRGSEIQRECGRRGLIGGQGDLIAEIAHELSQRQVAADRAGGPPASLTVMAAID